MATLIVETVISTVKLCERCYKCCVAIREGEVDEEPSPQPKKKKSQKSREYSSVSQEENEPHAVTAQPKPRSKPEPQPQPQSQPPQPQPQPQPQLQPQLQPQPLPQQQSLTQPMLPFAFHPIQNTCSPVFNIYNGPYTSPQLPSVKAESDSSPSSSVTKTEESIVKWIPSSMKDAWELENRAVIGGRDFTGDDLWIIRAKLHGEVIPGKLNYDFGLAFVAHKVGGVYGERTVEEFEVCCVEPEYKNRIVWVPFSDGKVPKNAIIGGYKRTKDPLYIGRVNHQDEDHEDRKTLCPGLINPVHGVLYITYGLKVYPYTSYEVLCLDN